MAKNLPDLPKNLGREKFVVVEKAFFVIKAVNAGGNFKYYDKEVENWKTSIQFLFI